MKRYNGLFDKLQNCFGANGKDCLYFPLEIVLTWFDLSTRDGKVSHVLAHVIRRLRGQCGLLVVFNGSTVQRLCLCDQIFPR